MNPDDIIDQASKTVNCRSYVHKQSEQVQEVLFRARDRIRKKGEHVSPAALTKSIQVHLNESLSVMSIRHYLHVGCSCE